MSSAILKANNEWLVWARKTAFYDIKDIANKMKVDENTIEEWESTGNIEYDELVELAKLYRRPPMIFFNVNKPEYRVPIPDLRTFKSRKKYKRTPEMSFEFRSADVRRKKLLRLEELSDGYKIPEFALKDVDTRDSTEISDIISDKIGMRGFNRKKNLDFWIKKIEDLGVLVFQFYGLEPKEIRGYTLYYDKLPIIGINQREYPNGKKFTLFHELAHVIIKKEGFNNFDNYFLKDSEQLCNKIAAETLVPSSQLEIKIQDKGDLNNWDDYTINWFSRYFKVSNEVIVRRLLELNYVTKEDYKSRKEIWDGYIAKKPKTGIRKKSDEDEIKPKKEPDHQRKYRELATMALKRNGEYYTKSILEAFDEDLISVDDVAENLGVPIEVVREIQRKFSVGVSQIG